MKSTINSWDYRAKILKDEYKSVMPQSFPDIVNIHIHNLHIREVESFLPLSNAYVLDVGCGWGRVSESLAKKNRSAKFFGIDISSGFVDLFNQHLKQRGKAIVGDMRNLPFKNQTFDLVYNVEAFEYLSHERDQEKSISEMLRVLKNDGAMILIAPDNYGLQAIRLWGLIPFIYRKLFLKPKIETYGISFNSSKLKRIIEKSGGDIVLCKGYPFLTVVLLPAIVAGKILPNLAKAILASGSFLDALFPLSGISYFKLWIVKKK